MVILLDDNFTILITITFTYQNYPIKLSEYNLYKTLANQFEL